MRFSEAIFPTESGPSGDVGFCRPGEGGWSSATKPVSLMLISEREKHPFL